MKIRPISGPHVGCGSSVTAIMWQVVLALLPATLFGIYLFGLPALFLFLVTVLSALFFEYLCLRIKGASVSALADGSALLTGWLLAMTMPPWAPWWLGLLGAAIAIVIGKQVFGGLGQNLFNPAMLARVTLLVSFPVEMTVWPDIAPILSSQTPNFTESLAITFGGVMPDGISGATVLGHVKTEMSQGRLLPGSLAGFYEVADGWGGFMRGSMGETSALLVLLGGLWLIYRRIISWRIPFAMLGAVFVAASLFHWIDPSHYISPMVHLSSGALMLVAFFIATDYVTSPNTPMGQIVFAVFCGLLIFIIRTWGAFPEAAGFAVLLMNAVTPLIDHYVKPRIYGRDRKGVPLESNE